MENLTSLLAGALVATTMTLAGPTPAAALGIHIGPRGVGVRLGDRGYRSGFRHRPVYRRGFHHRGFRRF